MSGPSAADANAARPSYAALHDRTSFPDKPGFDARAFFSIQRRKSRDFANLFSLALKKLGVIGHGEMGDFVPALASGAPATLDHRQKVKAIEHLVLLAQFDQLHVMNVHSADPNDCHGGVDGAQFGDIVAAVGAKIDDWILALPSQKSLAEGQRRIRRLLE